MPQARPLNETELWLMNLERERTDRSYLKPSKPEPEVVYVTRKVYPKKEEQETREKLMFNAGRYAAGARDKSAEAAHLWLQKELS